MDASPLPEELAAGPFSTARARELGVAPSHLRRSGLIHPTRGAHVGTLPTTLAARAAAYSVGMPSDRAYSHVTSAVVQSFPLPAVLEEEARTGPLHVIAPTKDGRVVRKGCVGHRGLEVRSTIEVDGIRVVGPADTWVDLGELRRGRLTLDDLVVVGDAVVARIDGESGIEVPSGSRSSLGTRALHTALHARVRPRGKLVLGQALDLVRPRVRSPMETRARLMFVHAGFPEPEPGGVIQDEASEFLAEGDLVWRRERVVAEYQGSAHADIGRRSIDAQRRHLLEARGWRVRELFSEDVHRRPRRIATLESVAGLLGLDASTLAIS